MATWRAVLCEPGGGGLEIMDLTSAMDTNIDLNLADHSNSSFSVSSRSEEARLIIAGANDVKWYRDGLIVDRHRIVHANREIGDPSRVTYDCVDYREMLNTMSLWSTDTAVITGYSGIDIETVGWNLINTVQARDSGSGSLGIVQDGNPTGRTITGTKLFDAGMTVKDAINGMLKTETTSTSDDAVEWWIEAAGNDLVYRCAYPRRGKTVAEADFALDNRTNVLGGSEAFNYDTYANVVIVQGNHGTIEMQSVACDTPTSGTFTLTFRGQTTSTINWNHSLETIQLRLESLSTIGGGNVLVTGSSPDSGPYFFVTFIEALAYVNQPALTASSSLVGSAGITIGESRAGSRYTATVYADDYLTSPYGRKEHYLFDPDLKDATSVDQRANYIARYLTQAVPDYDFSLVSALYRGRSDLDIGDYVIIDLSVDGYNTARTDLRCNSLSFGIGANGEETIDVTVGLFIPEDVTLRSQEKRIAKAQAVLNGLVRQLNRVTKAATAGKTKKQRAITKLEQENINRAKSRVSRYRQSHSDYNLQ